MAIDISVITDQFSFTDVALNVLIVCGTVAALVAWARATKYTLAMMRGDLGRMDRKMTEISSNNHYRKRFAREQRTKGYREWKRNRGF